MRDEPIEALTDIEISEDVITDTVTENGDGDEVLSEGVANKSDTANDVGSTAGDAIDYDEIIKSDILELRSRFPELSGIEDITDLDNPIRYAELRDLGLSPREAYLATSERRQKPDTRRHLSSAVPKRAAMPAGLSQSELSEARELFSGLSDAELNRLARRVNG